MAGIHIVAFPFPLQGHVNPMLVLCQRLCCSIGFKVTLVNNQGNHERLIQAKAVDGLGWPKERKSHIKLVGLEDGFRNVDAGMDGLAQAVVSSHNMRAPFEELIQQLMKEECGVACILSDAMVGWTQDVANKFNVPRAAYSTTSSHNDLIAAFLPQLMSQGYVPIDPHASYMAPDHRISFLCGMRAMHPLDLPFCCRMRHPINEDVCESYKRLAEAEFVLVNTMYDLEEEAVQAMRNIVSNNYIPIGPVLPIAYTEAGERELSEGEKQCLQWLDGQAAASVLYVSFGSIACFRSHQIEELLLGLQNSQQPFLLVMRDSLVTGLCSNFYNSFVEATKNRGYVTCWSPQMEVLGHPAVAGFLTHCGWNSTLEGIYNGVPMLGWPSMAEQNLNCMLLVKEWKVALEFRHSEDGFVDKAEVEDKITRLMGEEGKQLRNRVLKLKDNARNAVKEGGFSRSSLESFAGTIQAKAAKPTEMHSDFIIPSQFAAALELCVG